ncbi:MAG: molybdopterin cofactor-binding domain-containing protein [Acidimicrobiales bacterium]
MAVQGSILGNAVLRREDPSLLVGDDKFCDDLNITGIGHVYFVRSVMAHANIGAVDISSAVDMPGVRGVWTADTLEAAPFLAFPLFPPHVARPPLAKGKVRFVGDILAVVVADSLAEAIDAGEAVFVDYDELPAVSDAEAALASDAPVIFEEHGSNMIFETAIGADEDPLVGAEHITEGRVVSQRLAGVPMENNGCVVVPGDNGHLTIWISSQNPIAVRDALVPQLGLDAANVRVVAPAVGGGFGPKAGPYTEQILTTMVAMQLNQPVKWTELRSENMVAMVHGRDMVLYAKLGTTNDGIITGLDLDVIANGGAYPAIGAFLTVFTQTMSQGVYKIPKLRFHARSAITNTTTTAAYRGAGRPEATQVLERIIDMAAKELDIDPAEMRRRNFLTPDMFPLTTTAAPTTTVANTRPLDEALRQADYQGMVAMQAARRAEGGPRQLGIGLRRTSKLPPCWPPPGVRRGRDQR